MSSTASTEGSFICFLSVITVPALTSVWLDKVEFPNVDLYNEYISYELEKEGVIVSNGSVNFSYPKYFRYENPNLSYTVNGNEISIAGETFTIKELPKTITKKLTAYGHGYVPWEETITVTIDIE